jgi:hypothetical protein
MAPPCDKETHFAFMPPPGAQARGGTCCLLSSFSGWCPVTGVSPFRKGSDHHLIPPPITHCVSFPPCRPAVRLVRRRLDFFPILAPIPSNNLLTPPSPCAADFPPDPCPRSPRPSTATGGTRNTFTQQEVSRRSLRGAGVFPPLPPPALPPPRPRSHPPRYDSPLASAIPTGFALVPFSFPPSFPLS